MAPSGLVFRQLFDGEGGGGSSTYTYLLGDAASGEAVLIDPVLEQVDRDLQVIDQLGFKLKYAINTHCHADHITGTGKLKELRPEVQSIISEASGAKADIFVDDGDVIDFGGLSLRCLATPGHTDGCMSYYIPGMVFTGDALLVRGCGRTDFQQGDAGRLFDSVTGKIFSLPGDTLVYTGHDYKGHTCSSVSEEKQHNPRLTKGREGFIDLMANLKLAYPKKIDVALPANLVDGAINNLA